MDKSRRPKADSSKPCYQFQRGRCHYGSNCKFSHATNAPGSSSTRQSQSRAGTASRTESNVPGEDGLRALKRLIGPGIGSTRPSQEICEQFFQLAVELMDGDVGASQETIRLVAREDGLSFINYLVEHHIPVAKDRPTKVRLWLRQVCPLFRLVTHQRVVTSAVLEQEVAVIYNFMQGIGGRRMMAIFKFATSLLDVWSVLPMEDAPESSGLAATELCLAVLAKMMDCTTTNIVSDAFNPILQQLRAFIIAESHSPDDYYKLQAQKHVQYIQLRLGVGEALPTRSGDKQRVVTHAEFVIRKDLPGRLSAQGSRHDNDHDNIGDISILPTQEEINSVRSEYLPANDVNLFHIPGIRGRLDREFRLLREDTVGQLRDAVRAQLELMRNPDKTRKDKNGVRTYTYSDANVQEISFDRPHGLDLLVQFRQPAFGKEKQKRQDWWAHSKRLQPGGLVCVLSESGLILFCVVADTTIVTADQKEKNGRKTQKATTATSSEEKPSLAADANFAYVHLHVADTRRDNVIQALRWYRNIGYHKRRCLVEFPGVLLPSFQHTLEALQRMSSKPSLPFTELLAPSQHEAGLADVPPPQYAMKQGFAFDLTCVTNDNTTLRYSPSQPLSPQELATYSTLDATQSGAFLDALSRSLALIQGPPGTGKSFTGEKLIRALLSNKSRANLGPILCVCYTNHALDQLLEHLYDDGVKQIVRIGSRSKSEKLERVNLREVARTAERTKAEKHSLWESNKELDDHIRFITKLIGELQGSQSWRQIKDHLARCHPQHHVALFGKDEDGFQTVRRRPDQIIDKWRVGGRTNGQSKSSARQTDDLVHAALETLSQSERTRLYNHWLREIQTPIVNKILQEHREFAAAKDHQDKVRRDVDLRCLSEADVVGVTTTGLAKNLDLLQRMRCKVLLCEEAGEVLEAHTLTALLPSIEHAILIGDHQQLRPQIQNFDLQSTNPRGAKFSLDVSLFERLVSPPYDDDLKLPYSTLETQRRMHPSIAELIRSTLYPSLEDGGAVHKYPEVLGMKKRLFWLDHESLEDKATQIDPTTTSHTNAFEIEMTIALVQHLVRQGSYGPNDIAVITPYLGQLQRLRRLMERMFEISVGERDLEELDALEASKSGDEAESSPRSKTPASKTTLLRSIRLATVDNFQGEEAKVVVISLVRSNEQTKCGFLSTPNRINVLLSRAKHGMYLIGNAKTYGHVPMWAQVLSILEKNENVGAQLELQCVRHPNVPMLVSKPDHFLQFAPEGGCKLACDKRLSCGHPCINRCHSEILHNAVKCLEPCPRPKKGCDHPCPRSCGDTCEPRCNKRLQGISLALPCGHRVSSAFCWQVQDSTTITCNVMVKRSVPGCNHVVNVPCHTDVNAKSYECRAICGDPQSCGHSCRSFCHQCKKRADGKVEEVNHGICKQSCGRNIPTCRHDCMQVCHGDVKCPPCPAPCEVCCSHSKCSKQCHEPCAPCAEQTCASCCPHNTQCTMPCAAPCDWIPCSMRCEKLLDCGHQCPSLCGERCPEGRYCQECCSDNTKSTMVDLVMGLQYHEIDLNEDPCIFPDCGHFITKTSMDGCMDLNAHYRLSEEGNPMAISSNSKPFSMEEVKVCPTCRGSLRNIARYGRIVRRAMLDEATKKFIAWSNSEYHVLAERLINVQQKLSESIVPRALPKTTRPGKLVGATGRLKELYLVRDWIGTNRYNQALSLWNQISDFMGKVRSEEQPFQRVANFVQHAARQRQTQQQFMFDETLIQIKGQLQASALWLRCESIIFADFMHVRKGLLATSSRSEIKLDLSKQMKDCEKLVALAKSSKHHRQEFEGHVYFARFCALARTLIPEATLTPTETSDGSKANLNEQSATRDKLKEQGTAHLAAARELLQQYSEVELLEQEVEAAEAMLRDSVFYAPVSVEEMRAVYKAMAGEFRGTGHWYTCENGHPFTVGECGMPMQEARCPECGGVIGGTGHTPAAGVRRADDIETLGRGVGALGVH